MAMGRPSKIEDRVQALEDERENEKKKTMNIAYFFWGFIVGSLVGTALVLV